MIPYLSGPYISQICCRILLFSDRHVKQNLISPGRSPQHDLSNIIDRFPIDLVMRHTKSLFPGCLISWTPDDLGLAQLATICSQW